MPTSTAPAVASVKFRGGSAATLLTGEMLSSGWKVVKQLPLVPGCTGGNFSVGYLVEKDGTEAFLKALDFSRAMGAPDPARALQALTEAYNFERDILNKCRDHRMTRVVTPIADGSVKVRTASGEETVQYLILEKADCDSRSFVLASHAFDAAWGLRALHHIATGLRQLHSRGIAHQDVKPSNVLVFGGSSSKLTDVGRAAYRGHTPPHDSLPFAGDPAYAPLELLFGDAASEWEIRRLGCDCYLLGSMIAFFFLGAATTPAILAKMLPAHHPINWTGTYVQVLPYARHAFDQVVDDLGKAVPTLLVDGLTEAFRQLCDPDPNLRGHPRDRAGLGSPYSLERYISRFNTLASVAEVSLRRSK